MKKLTRVEMKNVLGGDDQSVQSEIGGVGAECTTECNRSQAGCGSRNDYKACSTGSGSFDWKCC